MARKNRLKKNKTAVVRVQKHNRKHGKNHKSRNATFGSGLRANLTNEYFNSLVDPFEHPGVRLGWGCLVPSTIVSAYIRSTTTANADGSLAFAILPAVTSGILVGNAGANVNLAGGATSAFTNTAAVIANASEGRVISVGVRAVPSIAFTSAPGVAYCGASVPTNYNDFSLLTPTDLASLPTSHATLASKGASSVGRPVDPDSFIFHIPVVDNVGYTGAANNAVDIPFSVPYISFIGLPANAVVIFEIVLNIEVLSKIGHAASTVLPAQGQTGLMGTLASVWNNIESMWNSVSSLLPPPGRAGEQTSAFDVIKSGIDLYKQIESSNGGRSASDMRFLPRGGGYGGTNYLMQSGELEMGLPMQYAGYLL